MDSALASSLKGCIMYMWVNPWEYSYLQAVIGGMLLGVGITLALLFVLGAPDDPSMPE